MLALFAKIYNDEMWNKSFSKSKEGTGWAVTQRQRRCIFEPFHEKRMGLLYLGGSGVGQTFESFEMMFTAIHLHRPRQSSNFVSWVAASPRLACGRSMHLASCSLYACYSCTLQTRLRFSRPDKIEMGKSPENNEYEEWGRR